MPMITPDRSHCKNARAVPGLCDRPSWRGSVCPQTYLCDAPASTHQPA
jgi:hypothetical protein